jgi:hypothetical protein
MLNRIICFLKGHIKTNKTFGRGWTSQGMAKRYYVCGRCGKGVRIRIKK